MPHSSFERDSFASFQVFVPTWRCVVSRTKTVMLQLERLLFRHHMVSYAMQFQCNATNMMCIYIFTYYDTLYLYYIYTYCYLYHHFITVDISQRYLVFSPTSPVEIYSHWTQGIGAPTRKGERGGPSVGCFFLPFLPRTPTYPCFAYPRHPQTPK